jgi:hypothetical protein
MAARDPLAVRIQHGPVLHPPLDRAGAVAARRASRDRVIVDRARVGGACTGDFGSFVLTLDEVR